MPLTLAVVATDEQRAHPVDLDGLRQLAHQSLVDSGVVGEAELNLLFVDEHEMATLNERFMHQPGPTDVLSFPIDDDHAPTGPGPRLLGDVVVCPAVAVRSAADKGWPVADELALLVVHGVLHVLGMDHAETDDAAAMQAREQELLRRWHQR